LITLLPSFSVFLFFRNQRPGGCRAQITIHPSAAVFDPSVSLAPFSASLRDRVHKAYGSPLCLKTAAFLRVACCIGNRQSSLLSTSFSISSPKQRGRLLCLEQLRYQQWHVVQLFDIFSFIPERTCFPKRLEGKAFL
jgi:hypothetical protein